MNFLFSMEGFQKISINTSLTIHLATMKDYLFHYL